jgi:quercetin dioxygenase-like cupin family protein
MAEWGEGGIDDGLEQMWKDALLEHATQENVTLTGYVRNPFEGESFSIGPMLVTFKSTATETAGRFALIEVTIPPYFADILPHLHRECTEAIYLTQGMLAVTLGEETMVVRQGSYILIPPQTVHRLWNPAATQATFLAYYTPAGVERFFAALATQEWPTGEQHAGALAEMWATGAHFDHHFAA